MTELLLKCYRNITLMLIANLKMQKLTTKKLVYSSNLLSVKNIKQPGIGGDKLLLTSLQDKNWLSP